MIAPAPTRLLSAALAATLALGCAGAGGAVRVVPLGATAEPRPPGCAIELLETRPTRPFEELAELTSTAAAPDGLAALGVLRDPACRLGADALLVTHRTTPRGPTSMVSAVAIRWLPSPAPAPRDEPPGTRSL
ncbi:MAG: hypothetical protein HZB56_15220 [Deltaproteobacteria bacterium]|nr:hypothetical protein [Deltaproteobacteria bacterium]